jgi:hypothetical protein
VSQRSASDRNPTQSGLDTKPRVSLSELQAWLDPESMSSAHLLPPSFPCLGSFFKQALPYVNKT